MTAAESDGDLPEYKREHLQELLDKDEDELEPKERTSKAKYSLAKKYSFPWLTVFEHRLRNGRQVDAMTVDTRPSRGMPIIVFEIKASREDWLRELRKRDKADLPVQLADEFYVVAAKRGIVKEDELPPGWGLLELKPKGALWEIVESDLDEIQNQAVDRRFWVKFWQKAHDQEFRHETLKEAEKRGYEKRKQEENEQQIDFDIKRAKEKADAYEKIRNSPLRITTRLDDNRIERLVLAENLIKAIRQDRFGGLMDGLGSIARAVDNFEEDVQETKDAIEKLREMLDEVDDAEET